MGDARAWPPNLRGPADEAATEPEATPPKKTRKEARFERQATYDAKPVNRSREQARRVGQRARDAERRRRG